YPYLPAHIPFAELSGKSVLEVGLGYGTISQKIAASGADYQGLDIAQGPVDMVNLRLKRLGNSGQAQLGNILDAPYEDESFDWVIAIGCLHHTGDLARAIDEVHRVLKKSGQAMIMVYSATSYRQFQRAPIATFSRLMSKPKTKEATGTVRGNHAERLAYDTNKSGEAAPETTYVSANELKHLCRGFSSCTITRENIGQDGIFRPFTRPLALTFAKYLGLDLYCSLRK
ncbi:MAG TPA: class I SAM-dependent methyltransferase, partial [Devosia sp.]|nr:class I SAM-dependent methyltransferase [Devosia sp.]